jgi:hypothetical protein
LRAAQALDAANQAFSEQRWQDAQHQYKKVVSLRKQMHQLDSTALPVVANMLLASSRVNDSKAMADALRLFSRLYFADRSQLPQDTNLLEQLALVCSQYGASNALCEELELKLINQFESMPDKQQEKTMMLLYLARTYDREGKVDLAENALTTAENVAPDWRTVLQVKAARAAFLVRHNRLVEATQVRVSAQTLIARQKQWRIDREARFRSEGGSERPLRNPGRFRQF